MSSVGSGSRATIGTDVSPMPSITRPRSSMAAVAKTYDSLGTRPSTMILSPIGRGTPEPLNPTLFTDTATPLPSSLQNSASPLGARVSPLSCRQGSATITISVADRITSRGAGGTAERRAGGGASICARTRASAASASRIAWAACARSASRSAEPRGSRAISMSTIAFS